MNNLELIINKVKDFPTLPTIYTKLMKTLADNNSTVKDVAEVISTDQSTVLKILKLANSPVFGLSQKINNVSDAIFYIGFTEVKNIVLALSVMKVFNNINTSSSFNIINYWKHSIGVGIITRQLGTYQKIKNIENYFISGILHDIGIMLLLNVLKDKYIEIFDKSNEEKKDLHIIEKKYLGFDHAFAGGLLAEKWKLPKDIAATIKKHHSCAGMNKEDKLVACVHLADVIAQILEFGSQSTDIIFKPNFKIWNVLNIEKNALLKMRQSIVNNFNKSVQILSV